MQILRQSTAVDVLIGPFLDLTNMATAEEGESPAVKLSKNGQALGAKNDATTPVHDDDGYYNCELDTTDTDTVGTMVLIIAASGAALPVRHEYQVVEENVYDMVYTSGADLGTTIDAIQTDTEDIQNRLPAALSSGNIKADILAISTDTTAANNLELQYDTTGLTGDTFPATQTQVSNLAIAGSAVNQPAKDEPNGFVIQSGKGENEANDEDSTKALDGTTHNIEAANIAATEQIDVYYEFNIGSGIPSSATFHGYLDKGGGAAKNITVQAQNVDATTWRTIGSITSGASIETDTFDLFINEVGTGANLGIVRIRFLTGSVPFSATTKLLVDQIFVSFSSGVEGYENGAIWIDTTVSNTGTVVGVDGTARNPVSTIAAANTLSASTNLNRFQIAPGSTITFAASQDDQVFLGHDWTLALGGRSIAGSYIEGAIISGIGTGDDPHFEECDMDNCTLAGCHLENCGLSGTITASAAATYTFNHCYSEVAGAGTPVFNFGAAVGDTSLNIRAYSGGIQVEAMGDTGTDTMSLEGFGQFIEGTCTGGTVVIRGTFTTSGITNLTLSDDARIDVAQINAEVDTALAALNDLSAAQINAEVSDVLKTDTITLPGQTTPPLTPTFEQALSWLYKVLRNRKTQTATQWSLLADDESTVDAKATVSDDGTTTTKQEITSGP